MKKLILHVPHAATALPSQEGFIPNSEKIQQEITKLTDWYTDHLFHSETDEMIVASFSRIFCDVERFENDEEEVMSKVGMGVLYERFDDSELLRTVTPELREEVIQNYYRPHHNALTLAVKTQLDVEGSCLIVDCHSFPSTPLLKGLDQSINRPDFNIGTDAFHTPQILIDLAVAYFEKKGYSLGIDWPYSGTIVPMAFYKKDKRVQSIMLEVNRKLYLKEPGREKSENYTATKKIVQGFLRVMKNN
jgi:N-formylglutamate amidohydrolase